MLVAPHIKKYAANVSLEQLCCRIDGGHVFDAFDRKTVTYRPPTDDDPYMYRVIECGRKCGVVRLQQCDVVRNEVIKSRNDYRDKDYLLSGFGRPTADDRAYIRGVYWSQMYGVGA